MKRLMTLLSAALSLTLALSAQEVPAYFTESGYLPSRISSIPKGKHFLFITDYHQERNIHHSTAVMSYIKQHAGINWAVFGGDCFDWAPNKEAAAHKLGSYFDELHSAFGPGLVWVQGNHDCNSSAVNKYKIAEDVALIPDVQCYELTVGKMTGRPVYDEELIARYRAMEGLSEHDRTELLAWARMHYWMDDTKGKIRFVVIETIDGGHTTRNTLESKPRPDNTMPTRRVVEDQLPFLRKAMETAPRGYDIVVLSHMIGHYRLGIKEDSLYEPMIRCVAEYRQAHKRRVVLISGHQHADAAFRIRCGHGRRYEVAECPSGSKIGEDEVLLIWTNRDAWKAPLRTRDAEGRPFPLPGVCPIMTQGTINEVSFDVVTFTKKTIEFTRIGAGSDRSFRW
ncbi:MAG: hypothetical protein IJV01_00975 [Bacteroidales bacterium]|nr:hypothetical protein [Bacteroidales bacterium]